MINFHLLSSREQRPITISFEILIWESLSGADSPGGIFSFGFNSSPYSKEESSASGSPEDLSIRFLIKTLIQRRRFQLLAAWRIFH